MDGKNNLFGYLFNFLLDSPDLTEVNYCNYKSNQRKTPHLFNRCLRCSDHRSQFNTGL